MDAADDRIWILIVDDDPAARAAAREAFAKQLPSAKTVEVSNPHEAMPRLEKHRFDLVVTDYELPRADGTFIDEIGRLAPEKRPFGIVVGFGRVNDIPKVGKVHFLAKPFDSDELLGVTREVLEFKLAQKNWEGGEAKPNPATGPAQGASAPSATATAAKKRPIDVNFINPFIEGAVVVMETVCSTKSDRESVFTRSADSIRGDISAVIAMNSSTKQGSFAISFEKKAFLAAAGRMLGETYTEINDENKDVVGEICNQIFGFAKRKLNNEMGYDIQPAIPSVVTGDNHQIRHLITGLVIAAKFKTAEGWFIVEAATSG